MKSVYNFVVTPKGERYNNSKKVGDSELIINTEIYNHQYVNREAKVISTPIIGNTDIKPGDTVIVHHNVFRRWHNVKGVEKNSRAYFNESTYFINQDSKIVKIILTNLLFNAIKYSEKDVHIKIYADSTSIYISLKDEGIGIPKKDQQLIFKRFFRAKNAIYYPGTGIGLNIVKGYLEKLNGSISFESTENVGTVFYVTLPKLTIE